MSQWWTYSPGDMLLFQPRVYWRLIQLHNEALWPLHIVALMFAAAIPVWLLRPRAWTGRAMAAGLAAAWLWVGWSFVWSRYASINWPMAYAAPAFAVQALLLLWIGLIRGRLAFAASTSVWAMIGFALVVYALVLHPLLAPLAGRPLQAAEVFAIMPDPTAIATLGLLVVAARPPAAWPLMVVPVAWCLVSWMTLTSLHAPQGWILLAAAVLAPAALAGSALAAPSRKH